MVGANLSFVPTEQNADCAADMQAIKGHLTVSEGILYLHNYHMLYSHQLVKNCKNLCTKKSILEFSRFSLQQHRLNLFNFFWKFWISANRQLLVNAFVMIPKVLPHTWPTQIPVLFLFTSIYLHTPSMIGKWEKVFYLWRRADGIVQSLKPILTLLKSRKLTPVPEINIYLLIFSRIF